MTTPIGNTLFRGRLEASWKDLQDRDRAFHLLTNPNGDLLNVQNPPKELLTSVRAEVAQLFEQIEKYQTDVTQHTDNSEEEFQGIIGIYVYEVCIGEMIDVDDALENVQDTFSEELYNLNHTCHAVFTRTSTNPWSTRPLDMTLLYELHTMLMCNVLEENKVGVLRTGNVASRNVQYPFPHTIHNMLLALLNFTSTLIVLEETVLTHRRLEWRLNLASLFVANFLYIHPFWDGNGRTARVVFSHLLRHYTAIPLSLYVVDKPGLSAHELYIQSLQASQGPGRKLFVWVRYVYECVKYSLDNMLELVLL